MRAIQENEMAEPGPRGLRRGLWGRQQSRSHKVTMHTNLSTPGCPRGGRWSFRSQQCGDRPEVIRAPLARPRPGLADPRRFLQPSPARLESLARSPDSQQHPTPSSPDESPACVLGGGPHASLPGTRVPPAANLLVRVCFFGHFLVHLDACPAAGSLAPFIFLCARPPSSHLRHLLIWWWRGELEMKGAPRQAEKRRSPSAGRGLGRGAPGSGRHRPAGRGPRAPNGRRGEIWEGDPEE